MSNSPSTLPPPQQTPPQSQQKPAFKDTDGGKAIVARQTIYGHQTLPEGAKLLYCFLLHTSFNKQTIPHKNGVVEISIKEISEGIHCCTRSINKWKKMLSAEGLIWVEKRKLGKRMGKWSPRSIHGKKRGKHNTRFIANSASRRTVAAAKRPAKNLYSTDPDIIGPARRNRIHRSCRKRLRKVPAPLQK